MDARDDMGAEIAREISHGIAKRIAVGIALFFGFLFFIAFGGFAVHLLWNWLMPDLFNLRRLTFWEALGLLALCRILFGGFGRGGHVHADTRAHGKHKAWWKTPKPPANAAPPAAPPSTPGSPEAINHV